MKPCCKMLVISVFFGGVAVGQGAIVYDNDITIVNNGRVNDPNFPVYLAHSDNFSLTQPAIVNQVSWLGAYKNGNNLPDNPDNFTINFYGFVGSTPGTIPLVSEIVGAAPRTATSQTLPGAGNPVFSYTATFPSVALSAGDYLVEIRNSHGGTKLWLWADADASPGDSYQRTSPTGTWQEFNGNGVAEFAFTIASVPPVPEPGVPILLSLAGFVFGLLNRRRIDR